MDKNKEQLNKFLVNCFNTLLISEERCLENISRQKLTLKEIHLIESIGKGENANLNTAGDIAKSLKITLGTLTISTNNLESKGFILRVRDEKDKRVVRLTLTESGIDVFNNHEEYHKQLVDSVSNSLSTSEQEVLINALQIIEKFFKIQE